MARTRGSYAKGIAKREEILDTALEIVARVGYSRATVRELAQAVGLSQTGLLHYFGSKEQLFIEILRRRDAVDLLTVGGQEGGEGTAAFPPDLARALADLQRHNSDVPGLVQLFSRLSAEAVEPDHPGHAYFRDRYRYARAGGADAIRAQQATGQLPEDIDADRLAVLVFALIDGLQMQWQYDPEIDMAEQLSYFWNLLGR
ncbi:TetR/AcrR family transcriptional regulator [Streptomyces sp. NBC_01260]|uniref:TetR/AcrR family transcriptional regulator n=1 Tax=Streptomyces TaxID=1883 RepID=UPI000F998C0B|nr:MULTISPECIES: TetR/AcrR family transcriptional regulator [Streptomyces]MBO0916606.1 TetR/AcrR family transcriptional regulator [Streptomyces laculatispora]MCX4768915.1 TetR/AcrR family transcriptional regulator [Streptomyces sp. NBC_01285]ROQ76925.1 TetR family transcriptional regulator [Streptomyces sp. CEV 2-1]RPK41018.1 HTH-type transcriptional regulator RutR [Streptomyces sp. ADI92-24]